jgi:hypothetical protein
MQSKLSQPFPLTIRGLFHVSVQSSAQPLQAIMAGHLVLTQAGAQRLNLMQRTLGGGQQQQQQQQHRQQQQGQQQQGQQQQQQDQQR